MQSTQSASVAENHAVSGSVALAAPRPEAVHVGAVIPFPTASMQPGEVQATEAESAPSTVPAPKSPIPPSPPAQTAGPTAPPVSVNGPAPDAVQQAVVSALAQQGHATASALISTARFTLEATSLRIEVPGMGKKMLALTVNAVAEKIIKQEVQRLGGPARFMVIPGEGVAATSTVSAPVAGSIQEAALEHPMVQRAREIFNAEVRSVVDLRNK